MFWNMQQLDKSKVKKLKYDTKVWSPTSEAPCIKDQSISFL